MKNNGTTKTCASEIRKFTNTILLRFFLVLHLSIIYIYFTLEIKQKYESDFLTIIFSMLYAYFFALFYRSVIESISNKQNEPIKK